MSKLFDALRKSEGALGEMALPVLGEQVFVPQEKIAVEESPEPVAIATATPNKDARTEAVRISANSPLLPFDGSDVRAAEQYRIIRTKLRHHPMQPKMIAVSSAMPGDGKTVSAANLAGALALEDSLRVLLVDADFRRSAMTKLLGLEVKATPGLAEVLRGEATLASALISVEQFPNLYVLHPGNPGSNPAELLTCARWTALTDLLRKEFNFTVFDAPPVGAVADYELLQLACDGVVLVARPDYTNRKLWKKALEAVPKEKQLGVILNCVEDWFLWKTHGYYYYSQTAE